jgi:regulator of sirC expression with transglutaminase-like and TPR domain
MLEVPSYAEVAATPDPPLDVLTATLAAEFREVDVLGVVTRLDVLGAELLHAVGAAAPTPDAGVRACAELLGSTHGFAGEQRNYDDPANSMIDLVLTRRRGLPILLSVVYVEVARRAGVALAGVGLPGHFVVGHFGGPAPLLCDPFAGGGAVQGLVMDHLVRPWTAKETAMRILNNLVGSYQRRGDVGAAIRAAQMRLALPADEGLADDLRLELRSLEALLN